MKFEVFPLQYFYCDISIVVNILYYVYRKISISSDDRNSKYRLFKLRPPFQVWLSTASQRIPTTWMNYCQMSHLVSLVCSSFTLVFIKLLSNLDICCHIADFPLQIRALLTPFLNLYKSTISSQFATWTITQQFLHLHIYSKAIKSNRYFSSRNTIILCYSDSWYNTLPEKLGSFSYPVYFSVDHPDSGG